MFTTLTIAMTLSGAVAVETPAIRAEATRPALIQVAANGGFGKGNISSGNRERRPFFSATLAAPPGGNKPFGNGKGSNGNTGIGNGVGSNGGNAGFGNGKGSNGGNAAFGNGKGSNGQPTGYATGAPQGYPTGTAAPKGYSTGAPQGYATGAAPAAPKEPANGQQGNANGIGFQGGEITQLPAGNGHNGTALTDRKAAQELINVLGRTKG